MGTGSGAGVGTGKGVKGGWRVNAFLLLLTGCHAVLLPWSPLILKDTGFSATSVGLLSGGTTLAASVGVVACLRAMRRSRSGAVRRLLLWMLFAGATVLRGCGVVLLLQYIPHTGLLQSCVNGWSFAPTISIFPQNTTAPSAVSLQHPQPLPPGTNTTSTSSNTSTGIAPTLISSTSTSTTTSTSATIPPTDLPAIPAKATTTKTPTTTPTTHATTPPIAGVPHYTPSHITIPADQNQKSNETVPVNSNTINEQPLNSDYPEGSVNEYPEGAEEEAIDTGATVEPQPKTPLTKEKLKNAHKNKIKSSLKNVHNSSVSYDGTERGIVYQKTTKYRNKPPHKDSQANYLGDDIRQDLDENDSSEEDDDEDGVGYEGNQPKHNSHSKSGGKSVLTSSGFQRDSGYGDVAKSWKPQPRLPLKRTEATLHSHPETAFFSPQKGKPSWESASLRNNEVNSLLRFNPNPAHHSLQPWKESRGPHNPARTLHPPKVAKDLSGDDLHYDHHDSQVRSHHTMYTRSRRSIHRADSGDDIPAAESNANKTVPQQNKIFDSKLDSVNVAENIALMAGVAVFLALGGLLGDGVEASVAQLWHCYVYGYDEGGVSQDVMQRTITHTFHLSAYGSHKSWTGITSGGWAMTAGVLSILACLAGTGGSGYGGLLGVHLALGLAALLFLLVLPVPYGSIDPPKTRRPLSLYLDDEVLREGVRRLTFHLWVFVNGCLAALSHTFSLWLLQEMTTEDWLLGSQAAAVGVTLVFESLALHTQRRLVTRWGLHGLMGVCGGSLTLHYGVMWASGNVGLVVAAHAGLGVATAFLWVAVKHNALLLATVSDQEREAWASWWCWRLGLGVGAAVWSVGVSGAGGRVRPLLLPAALVAATLASVLCVTAVVARRHSRTRRRVYHTLDLDVADEEDDVDDAAEDDWLVKRAKKEGITL